MENDTIFFKIWRNCYLLSNILYHVGLYKENRIKTFNHLKTMREYNQLSYVTCLEYNASAMITSKEDELPNFGSLTKLVLLKPELGEIKSSQVPDSVEILEYPSVNSKYQTNLIGLPNSVATVRNVFFSCHHTYIVIPKSITSLHFTNWPNYNQELLTDGWLTKSNLSTLNLGLNWDNGGTVLKSNVFPPSLTDLNLGNYKNGLSEGILPNTIVKLRLSHGGSKQKVMTSELIPSSVKYLAITSGNGYFTSKAKIESLPSTVTSLNFIRLNTFNNGVVTKEMIPSKLISFSFSILFESKIFFQYDSLPNTLQSFICTSYYDDGLNQPINNLFSRLDSLTYIEIGNGGFDHQLFVDSFPPSLKTLKIGSKSLLKSSFNQPFDQCFSFPSSLTFLALYCPKYTYEINNDIFPSSLKFIELTNNFKSLLNDNLIYNHKSKIKFIV